MDPHGYGKETVVDQYAPDAFALQVLGPGYKGRIPPAPSYVAKAMGDSTILEHRALGEWFDEPFVPFDTHFTKVAEVKPPAVLAEARAELAPILYVPPPPRRRRT